MISHWAASDPQYNLPANYYMIERQGFCTPVLLLTPMHAQGVIGLYVSLSSVWKLPDLKICAC